MRKDKQPIDKSLYKEICDKYLLGIKSKQLSEEYKCAQITIWRILQRSKIPMRSISENIRKFYVNDNFFNKIDTEEKAYILGFLYADGYNYEKMQCLELSLQDTDLEILEKIRDCITEKHLYKIKSKINNRKDQYKLSVYSNQISKDLKNLGCYQNKSLTLQFPTSSQVPSNLIRHFIRGYFDGDGCISFCPQGKYIKTTLFFCGTLDFANGLSKSLSKFGINNSVIQKCGNIYKLHYGQLLEIKKLEYLFYKDSTIFMERKYNKFKELIIKSPSINKALNEISHF